MSQQPEKALDAFNAIDAISTSITARHHTPDLSISLIETGAEGPHEMSVEPSEQLQIGYLYDCAADERMMSFPDVRVAAQFAPLGSLYFVPPQTAFRTRCNSVRGTALACMVDVTRFSELAHDNLLPVQRSQFEQSIDMRDPELRRLLSELVREMAHQDELCGIAIDSLMALILVRLCRHASERASKGALPPWQLRRIEEIIREEASRPMRIADLAEACGLSSSYLMRAFKRTTGKTIGMLIEEVRIDRAKALLRESDTTITAIASQLSFSSRSHFSAAFRRSEGIAPLHFRQMMSGHGAARH